MNTDGRKAPQMKSKAANIVFGIIFGVLAVFNAVLFILFGTYIHAVLCVFMVIFTVLHLAVYEKKPAVSQSILVRVVAVLAGVFVMTFVSPFGRLGIYDLKLRYADSHGYETGHFPKSTQGMTIQDMELLPSIGQGDGYVRCTFCDISGDTLASMESAAGEKAVISFTGRDYINGTIPEQTRKTAESMAKDSKNADIYVHMSPEMKEKLNSHDVMIYITDSNFFIHHIRTDSVIIDRTDGSAEYTGM